MELPAGWAWARLGDLGDWYGGGTPAKNRPEFWTNGSTPWLSPKDMGSEVISATQNDITEAAVAGSAVRIVPSGSVAIVVRSGILERIIPVALVPFETTLNQDMKAVRAREGILPRWIAWSLRAFEREILRDCRKAGTTVASLSTDALMDLRVPLAPIAEQHRIVDAIEDHLSRLDAASRSLTHAQALIPSQRRALHTAATEGRIFNRIGDTSDFLTVRLDSWRAAYGEKKYREPAAADPDHIPVVPRGWKVFSLEALTDPVRIIRYGILMPKVKSGGTVPYVEVKDLRGCSLHGKKLHLTSAELDAQFAGARIKSGDVLLAVRGSYDRSAVVSKDLDGANVSRDVARIAPLPGIHPEYLHLYLQSNFSQRYLKAHARGVAVKGVNIASIRALPVAVPSLATQVKIIEVCQQQLSAIDSAEKATALSSSRCMALRQSVLARAFSGKLVHQDPADEPASVLLDRIRTEREAQGAKPKRPVRRPRKAAAAGDAPPPPPASSSHSPTTAVQQELPL
ncbi:restriction endonuclease subunit S [Streptomyces sp. NPDC005245]|uniref:restriction endonuclease subunit S n=1 Tax=Streptomyces sp. NPDC005245 TaxID=3157029 RepID=UPI0033B84A0A